MGFSFSQQPKAQPPTKFKSEELQNLAAEFCLQRQEVIHLYSCFSSFQERPKAYLRLDDMASSLNPGHQHYSELPYLERLFTIISKKAPGKLFFEEYIAGVSTFCLMNGEAILHFVFDWLDKDGDELISREDIAGVMEFSNPQNQQQTFLCDFMPDLDKILHNQHLNFESFRQMSNKMPFLIWPAYELQEKLRKRNLGEHFWQNLYQKIDDSERSLRTYQRRTANRSDKIAKLAELKTKRASEALSVKEQIAMRMPEEASTDMQLLEISRPTRRNSCPYIKAQLSSSQPDILEESIDQ